MCSCNSTEADYQQAFTSPYLPKPPVEYGKLDSPSIQNCANKNNRQRGLKNRSGLIILFVLYTVFLLSSALLALEIAQLFGLVDLLLYPNNLSTDDKFARLYALIARDTSITGVLFECQVREN